MGVSFPEKKRYEGVRFNVISVTRGWAGSLARQLASRPSAILLFASSW